MGCFGGSAIAHFLGSNSRQPIGKRVYRDVQTGTGSELVGPNQFTEISFDDLLVFTLLIRNWFKLHMFMFVLSTTETMEPFLVVCVLLWAKMMLLHHFRTRPSCCHLFDISR